MATRDTFLTGAAAMGGITLPPYRAGAAGHGAYIISSAGGEISVHPISHASFVMQTPAGTVYVDPVGEASLYGDLPARDLILVTHEHGDHFNAETLTAILGDDTTMIVNPAVFDMLSGDMQARATSIGNGETAAASAVSEFAPTYVYPYHYRGRDNGTQDPMEFANLLTGDTEAKMGGWYS